MKRVLLIAACFSLKLYAQSVPQLLKDIFPGTDNADPVRFALVDDFVLFFANDGENGIELWRTDATEAGTYMVKNIGAGAASHCGSTTGCGNEMIVMNNILYFRASDPVNGAELWRSDGTEAGTYMVKDINPGIGDCSNSFYMNGQYFAILDNVLYFSADGGGDNIELWRSDGTETGTYLVKDFAVGESSIPQYISAIDGAIYFQCKNEAEESQLWKSDGTEAGCELLKQMWVRSYDYAGAFIKYNDAIYFSGDDDADAFNFELWKTDGTPAGTVLFMELNPETDDGSDPQEFHIINDKLIFSARPASNDVLFVTDGTTAGTIQLKDKNGDDFEADFYQLVAENKIYFQGNNEDDDAGLWITDGTDAGTFFLSAIESGGFEKYTAAIVTGNNIIYRGYDDDNGCAAIFQSNGTPSGTFQSISCDVLSSPSQMITYNGKVIFNATSDAEGSEPWLLEPEFEVGIQDVLENMEISVYPNPGGDRIQISNIEHGILNEKIIIQTSEGRIIKSISFSTEINISDLLPGIYLIRINTVTQKFIKQ